MNCIVVPVLAAKSISWARPTCHSSVQFLLVDVLSSFIVLSLFSLLSMSLEDEDNGAKAVGDGDEIGDVSLGGDTEIMAFLGVILT